MQEQRWHIIEETFRAAVVLPEGERRRFVAEKCGGDSELCREVFELLDEDRQTENFLNEPVFFEALKILDKDFSKLLGKNFASRYKFLDLLGRGGMSTVFLAEDLQLKRRSALKIVDSSIFSDNDNVRRFEREARAASNISHPNVAHVYEFGHHENFYFLAMEYVEGKSLRELIKEEALDTARIVKIVRQIAEALSAAHRKNIIHRDIKPENIIVAPNDLVKVLDFGLAKACGSIENEDQISVLNASVLETTPGLIIGTTAYMSPEQTRGMALDSRTDLWSLGVIFYEMLSKSRPFEGTTRGDLIAAVLKNDPPPLSKKGSGISPALERIVLKLLEKDCDRRFQTAEDFLRELESVSQSITGRARAENGLRDATAAFFKRHKIPVFIFLILFLPAAGTLAYKYVEKNYAAASVESEQIRSIAVLPFINEDADPDKEYLSDGLTEIFIHRLSQLPDLTVKARNSVFHYKGKDIDIRKIGRELSVQAVLLGRVAERGGELKLNLELVDCETGNQIWGEQYSYTKDALIEFRREIVQDVSNQLRSRLSSADARRAPKFPTENAPAYHAFLRGRYHWSKRTAKDLQKSVEYYEHAIRLDPDFAHAYAGLADTYVLLSGYGAGTPQESFPKAKQAAQTAIRLDESLAEAHTALAYVLFNYDWNFEESEKQMRRAIELNPNYSTAHHWYGNANLLAMGKIEESIASVRRAHELDPLSLIINADLGTAYLYAGQYENALAQYKRTLELDENFYYAHAYLGRTYMMMGEYDKAADAYRQAQPNGADPRVLALTSINFAKRGDRDQALKKVEEMKRLSGEKYVSPYFFALAYTALGDKDEAFEWLEKAFEVREGRMTLMKADPLLAPLHSDPRFTDLLKRVGLEK